MIKPILVAAAAAVLAAAPVQAAPMVPVSPGQNWAAGYMADPNSGACWKMAGGGAPTIGGGPCMPGRIGLCLGYLANNPNAGGSSGGSNSLPTNVALNDDSW